MAKKWAHKILSTAYNGTAAAFQIVERDQNLGWIYKNVLKLTL